MKPEFNAFRDRVRAAAEAALKAEGAVGPLELFQHMQLLHPCHVEGWRQGNPYYRALEPSIQVGQEKLDKTLRFFEEWIQERGLRPLEAPYTRQTPRGPEPLQVTENGDPEREQFYRIRYAPAGLSGPKAKRLSGKLAKAPGLVVFLKVSAEGNCVECGAELINGNFLFLEKGRPLCLACADLDRLVFLPAGDTALSRRARKHSPLSAVVVRFSRTRRRYERQGLLVTAAALAQAREECAADAPERAARRAQTEGLREVEDRAFVQELTGALLKRYPGCPPSEAQAIAEHTGQRGSGRVGRSAAGREFDAPALDLAVRAHVRHEHTHYDELLMQGTERLGARALVQDQIDQVLAGWAGA
jgi:hypothetical protein